MADNLYPRTISGFTEYIKIAYAKAEANLNLYGVAPEKLTPVTPLYNTYVAAEAVAASPDTATAGARRARNIAHKALESAWRKFLKESIRYNSAVPAADLEVFGVKAHDTTRTPVGIPDKVPVMSIRHAGARRYEIKVLDSETGKKKKPQYAAGSYVYLAVTEVGGEPKHESEYRKLDFSSNCRHVIEFPLEQLAKQAHLYARYSNVHGREGPESIAETVIIG
ncbi:MAG: hypothetical protein LBP50_00620 [Tannerella sp.]|jgi:hypothetical protein|nr:hypothetical protein [Tannerella sp.]